MIGHAWKDAGAYNGSRLPMYLNFWDFSRKPTVKHKDDIVIATKAATDVANVPKLGSSVQHYVYVLETVICVNKCCNLNI